MFTKRKAYHSWFKMKNTCVKWVLLIKDSFLPLSTQVDTDVIHVIKWTKSSRHPLPHYFCILQAIKTGQWEGLGTRLLYMWQSNIIPMRISSAQPHSNTELPLGVGLICICVNVSSIHEFTQCVWVPPVMEVLRYSALNAVMQSQYATE